MTIVGYIACYIFIVIDLKRNMTMLQPLRLGFKSSTCTFAVEYRNEATGQNQLYAMALAQKLQMYPVGLFCSDPRLCTSK